LLSAVAVELRGTSWGSAHAVWITLVLGILTELKTALGAPPEKK
jgi:hypothetical protein